MNFNYFHYCHPRWKYILNGDYLHELSFVITGYPSITWATLLPSRVLILKDQYAWNGADWFPDVSWIIRGSAVHDALLNLYKAGKLPKYLLPAIHNELRKCCLEDGASEFWANVVYHCVSIWWKFKRVERRGHAF